MERKTSFNDESIKLTGVDNLKNDSDLIPNPKIWF